MLRKHVIAASALAIAVTGGATYVVGGAGGGSAQLRKAVTYEGIRAHQWALQQIADTNGGTRASGTPGYDASLQYVKEKLDAAGYNTKVQRFNFAYFEEVSEAQFSQVAPELETYVYGEDFLTMDYSASGNVTAVGQGVIDNIIPPTNTSSSNAGCEPADFAGFVPGNIAVIQRGFCTFAQKVANAAAAGASAAIIFNEGNPGQPERIPLFGGTLGTPGAIPALSVSYPFGEALLTGDPKTLSIVTDTISEIRSTANLLADTPDGRNDRVLVVGAHMDSVADGPGIQDNGTGTASNLEIALQLRNPANNITPRNKVRFAFWGAEESGLLGAEYYIAGLTKQQQRNINLNLNFDMIGSPNFGRFVYDGDGSDSDPAGPQGSDIVEDVFNAYFDKMGMAYKSTAFDGRSDYGPFIAVGIPAGGLFTGAEDIKTEEEAEMFGGEAGVAFDICYHQACDTYDNISKQGLTEMSDAAAHAVHEFAMTRRDVAGDRTDRVSQRVASESLLYKGSHLQK